MKMPMRANRLYTYHLKIQYKIQMRVAMQSKNGKTLKHNITKAKKPINAQN